MKGLSREFGVCYSCSGSIDPTASLCPQCNRLQDPPPNPDLLLESRDVVGPGAAPAAPSREPSLAEGDEEFVIPTLGGMSDESLAAASMVGSGEAADASSAESPRRERDLHREAPPRRDVEFSVSPAAASTFPSPAAHQSPPPTTPYSIPTYAPAAPRKTENEGFLSAKDLAAAFKLEFNAQGGAADPDAPTRTVPAARRTAADRRRPPRGRSSGTAFELPEGFENEIPIDPPPNTRSPNARETLTPAVPSDVATPNPGPRPMRVIGFLLFFAIAVFGAALYLDNNLRGEFFNKLPWLKRAVDRVSEAVGSASSDAPKKSLAAKATPRTPPVDSGDSEIPHPAAPKSAAANDFPNDGVAPTTNVPGDLLNPSPSSVPAAPPTASATVPPLTPRDSSDVSPSSTGDTATVSPAARPQTRPAMSLDAPPATPPAPVRPVVPSVAAVAAPKPVLDPDVAANEVSRLYKDGIDAQGAVI